MQMQRCRSKREEPIDTTTTGTDAVDAADNSSIFVALLFWAAVKIKVQAVRFGRSFVRSVDEIAYL